MRKNGISLIILVITILIMTILSTIIISQGINMSADIEYIRFEKENETVEKAVRKAKLKGINYGDYADNYVDDYYQQMRDIYEIYGVNIKNNFYLLNSETLKTMGIKNLSRNFFVNYETEQIFATEGIIYNGNIIYTIQ